jgi:hypothetical protein
VKQSKAAAFPEIIPGSSHCNTLIFIKKQKP